MLQISAVSKNLDGQDVLSSVSLDILPGEFFSIVGPSGCGKTTLLRILAGFEMPDSGSVLWNHKDISKLPANERPFNMVFQRYALFPHMTVYDNVAFGPSLRGLDKREIRHQVGESLKLVGMQDFEHRMPNNLSGGQQQRVALARAIVNKPQVILLDEPLSALDQKLRDRMRIELITIQRSLGITFVHVTHDQEEALTMSDKIAIFNHGHLEQCASPEDIYYRPATAFVADFIGAMNTFMIRGETVYVRPEDITMVAVGSEKKVDDLEQEISEAVVREILFKGPVVDFVIDPLETALSTKPILVQTSSALQHNLTIGSKVALRWKKFRKFPHAGASSVS